MSGMKLLVLAKKFGFSFSSYASKYSSTTCHMGIFTNKRKQEQFMAALKKAGFKGTRNLLKFEGCEVEMRSDRGLRRFTLRGPKSASLSTISEWC